ncbi:MAG: DNA translocase FtsK, partial [Rikenellaceae bacterium]
HDPLKLGRVVTLTMMLLICGSTTLGAIFGSEWAIFGSGWGGDFGIEIAEITRSVGGNVGLGLALLLCWVGIGVFINRNFIRVMNNVGSAALDRGEKIVDIVKRGATRKKSENTEVNNEEVDDDSEPLAGYEEHDKIDSTEELESESDEDTLLDSQPNNEPSIEIIRPAEEATTDGGIVVTVEANDLETVSEDEAQLEKYDPTKDLYNYEYPHPSLLEDYKSSSEVTPDEIFENKSKIEETLKYFGIGIINIKATVGPTITLYEIIQEQGVKISKIQNLENDIAQSLKATGIRIIAPIPGRGTIGIEVPNRSKQVVSMYSSVRSVKFQELKAELPIVIGRTIQNESYVFDLAKMPHLLVAGATGQGKSVGLNAIITSLLYRKHPSQFKFVMIDPKMVEFTPYKTLEHHFMAKMESEDDVIITDPKKAVYTLNALCEEMEKRLKLLSIAAVRNIIEYNDKFTNRRLNPEKGHLYMPYIVVVVDEFADLIMMTREVEVPVMRLAQKARAVGIHLIVATQRPDVKVITGGIKANFPARIAFRVMQMIDSRTIIDQPGANQLIGRGDMLFSKDGELTRIQCALVETDEVGRIVEHISKQQGYPEPYHLPDYTPDSGGDADMGESGGAIKYDTLFAEIARTAVSNGAMSTSAIQRNFEVGFNRAGRIMSQLERSGIVGRQEGAKPREILFHDLPSLEAKLQSLGLF